MVEIGVENVAVAGMNVVVVVVVAKDDDEVETVAEILGSRVSDAKLFDVPTAGVS